MKEIIISPILSILILIGFATPVYADWIDTGLGWKYSNSKNEILRDVVIDGYPVNTIGIWNGEVCNLDSLSEKFIQEISSQLFDGSYYVSTITFTNIESTKRFNDYFKQVYYLGKQEFNLYYNSNTDDNVYAISLFLNSDVKKALLQHAAAVAKVQEIVLKVKDKSDTEKISFINKWITDNTSYDESITKFKVYDLLFSGKSVCSGYAQLCKAMCNAAGLESRYVVGNANNQTHAFNQVTIDGNIKYIDSAWNAQSKTLTWYLLDKEQLQLDHTISLIYE